MIRALEQIALLRPLVGAGLIILRSSWTGRRKAGAGRQGTQQQRSPRLLRT